MPPDAPDRPVRPPASARPEAAAAPSLGHALVRLQAAADRALAEALMPRWR